MPVEKSITTVANPNNETSATIHDLVAPNLRAMNTDKPISVVTIKKASNGIRSRYLCAVAAEQDADAIMACPATPSAAIEKYT